MNAKERELLAAIGIKPCRVLTRWPVTIAVERHAYLPGLFAGLLTFVMVYRHGAVTALAAAVIAGVALTLSMVAHEAGHLLLGREAKGVTPRLILMRATGGVSILEGRFEDARGAASFAAGGPMTSLAVSVLYLDIGLQLPMGAFRTALLLPAVINAALLALNLLPLAPMDGYMLFRSALWASIGSRAEADRRAIRWSRRLLFYGGFISLALFWADHQAGVIAGVLLASFVSQHHMATRKLPARTRSRH